MRDRKHLKRKGLAVAWAAAAAVWGLSACSQPSAAATTPRKQHIAPVATAAGNGRYVASIEMLAADPAAAQTMAASLKALHASVVYLYAAYHGETFFPISSQARSAGLREVADTLPTTLTALRHLGYKVVVVVSSALLGPDPGEAAQSLNQPGSSMIDPRTAGPVVASLVTTISQYRPDGIYVGEPFDWPHSPKPATPNDWLQFYRQVRRASQVPLTMLLPTDRDEVGSVSRTYALAPLIRALATSHLFSALGVDAEGIAPRLGPSPTVTRNWERTAPLEFAKASRRLGGTSALEELPIVNTAQLGKPMPLGLFAQSLKAAREANVQGIVIFAGMYLSVYSPTDQARIGADLLQYLQ